MRTIRQQLLIGLLCATLACVLGAGTMLYRSLLAETNELADLQLRQLAGALPGDLSGGVQAGSNDPEEEFVLQAWNADSSVAHRAVAAGLTELPRYQLDGYAQIMVNGDNWRVYGEQAHGRYVQVGQPQHVRDELALGMAWRAGAPLLVIAVLFAALMLVVVGRALRPLDRLAQAVVGQSPTALQPLDPDSMTPDLLPVVTALNGLMGKFDEALAAQRTFVADAAHELRSPLTALKLQLQLVERADGEAARALALSKMHERLDRGSHLVRQLLSLARHESGLARTQLQAVEVNKLLASVVSDHSALADSREIDLGVESFAPLVLQADPDGLRVLLNNLVDNALRYTQRGGRVDLLAGVEQGQPFLCVRDNGPGVAPALRERLFDRFYRPDGNDVWGAGLGLSIVRNIADHHRAAIRLDNGEGEQGKGLSVTVLFTC
ncbi:two-component sensor histidine kinase [Duganella sp. sic0402]|uniref:ATP-binding protein n=1 Tax=Duganella sp. sic0402 TaxID=2854786 RepID=UPI001C437D77|nr:ATP-binding protein [Duganella sp. sic0402]MBV7536837.1 two-component sensor histidine kinase [Duganella sp. sic0402]